MINKKENWHAPYVQSACVPGHYLVTAEVGYDFGNLLTFVTVGLGIPVSGGTFKQRNKNFTLGFDLARYQSPCNFYKRSEEVL